MRVLRSFAGSLWIFAIPTVYSNDLPASSWIWKWNGFQRKHTSRKQYRWWLLNASKRVLVVGVAALISNIWWTWRIHSLCRQRHEFGGATLRFPHFRHLSSMIATRNTGPWHFLHFAFASASSKRWRKGAIHHYTSLIHQYISLLTPVSPSLEVEVEELSPVVDPETKKGLHVNFKSYIQSGCDCCRYKMLQMPEGHFFTVSLLAIRQVPKHCTSIVRAESSPQNCWLQAFCRWMRPLFSTTFHRPNRHTNVQCFSAHPKRFHSVWDAHRRAPLDLAKGDTKPWVVQNKDSAWLGNKLRPNMMAKAQKWQNKRMGDVLNS